MVPKQNVSLSAKRATASFRTFTTILSETVPFRIVPEGYSLQIADHHDSVRFENDVFIVGIPLYHYETVSTNDEMYIVR